MASMASVIAAAMAANVATNKEIDAMQPKEGATEADKAQLEAQKENMRYQAQLQMDQLINQVMTNTVKSQGDIQMAIARNVGG
jgi:hypothetical protein